MKNKIISGHYGWLIVIFALPMIAFACGPVNPPGAQEHEVSFATTPIGEEVQPQPGQEDVRGIIQRFGQDSSSLEADIAAIEAAMNRDPEHARMTALEYLGDENRNVRFAALYVLARTAGQGESLEALVPFLDSGNTTERMLAAQTLLASGEKAGFPVLIAALDSEDYIDFWDPPQQAWELASFTLIQYTDEDLGLIASEGFASIAAARPAWQRWWEENQESLVWDAASGVWEIGQ